MSDPAWVRHGSFKANFLTGPDYGNDPPVAHAPRLLYNLDVDPSERFDVAGRHPDVIAIQIAAQHRRTVEPVASQLDARIPWGAAR